MIVYNGGSFVSSLINTKLIDEFHLFVNPVVLGSDRTILKDVGSQQRLTSIKLKSFECGIVVLQ